MYRRRKFEEMTDDERMIYEECYLGFLVSNNKYITYPGRCVYFHELVPKMIKAYSHNSHEELIKIFNDIKWLNADDCKDKDNEDSLRHFQYLFSKGILVFNYFAVKDLNELDKIQRGVTSGWNKNLKATYKDMGIEEDLDDTPSDFLWEENRPIQKVDGQLKLLQYNFCDEYKKIEGIPGIIINLDNDTLEIYSDKLEGLDIPYVVDRKTCNDEIRKVFEKTGAEIEE